MSYMGMNIRLTIDEAKGEKMKERKITVRISESDYNRVAEIALNEKRGISDVVRDGVKSMLSDSMNIVVLRCQLADELKTLEKQIARDEGKAQIRELGKMLWN